MIWDLNDKSIVYEADKISPLVVNSWLHYVIEYKILKVCESFSSVYQLNVLFINWSKCWKDIHFVSQKCHILKSIIERIMKKKNLQIMWQIFRISEFSSTSEVISSFFQLFQIIHVSVGTIQKGLIRWNYKERNINGKKSRCMHLHFTTI